MVDWEALYRALVRRLVEIADDTAKHFDYQSDIQEQWHPTVNDFITVTRAHEKTAEDLLSDTSDD
jgi:conjugal transfer/entry exclusion protein